MRLNSYIQASQPYQATKNFGRCIDIGSKRQNSHSPVATMTTEKTVTTIEYIEGNSLPDPTRINLYIQGLCPPVFIMNFPQHHYNGVQRTAQCA